MALHKVSDTFLVLGNSRRKVLFFAVAAFWAFTSLYNILFSQTEWRPITAAVILLVSLWFASTVKITKISFDKLQKKITVSQSFVLGTPSIAEFPLESLKKLSVKFLSDSSPEDFQLDLVFSDSSESYNDVLDDPSEAWEVSKFLDVPIESTGFWQIKDMKEPFPAEASPKRKLSFNNYLFTLLLVALGLFMLVGSIIFSILELSGPFIALPLGLMFFLLGLDFSLRKFRSVSFDKTQDAVVYSCRSLLFQLKVSLPLSSISSVGFTEVVVGYNRYGGRHTFSYTILTLKNGDTFVVPEAVPYSFNAEEVATLIDVPFYVVPTKE